MNDELDSSLPLGYERMEEFLATDDYKEKLDILERMMYIEIDRIVITNMAASIDVVLPEGDVDDMKRSLLDCVRTRARF